MITLFFFSLRAAGTYKRNYLNPLSVQFSKFLKFNHRLVYTILAMRGSFYFLYEKKI